MSEDVGKKATRAIGWSSITEIMAKLVSPIVNIVLARLLAPEAFGAVATITMIISFAELFTDAGFQKYIIQHDFSSKEELDNNTNVAFWTNLGVSIVIVALIIVFRTPLSVLVGSPGLENGIAASSLIIILVSFSSIQTARFRRDLNFKPLFFIRIGSSIIPLLVTVPLAFVFKNFWALVIGNLAVNVFNSVALTLCSKWKPRLYYSIGLLKKMLSFSLWTLLDSILVWFTANVDVFIVGTVLNTHYLGIYKTSMTTVNAYMSIIVSALVPVLFSTLSRYQNDDVEFHNTFNKFQKYIAMFVLPMSAGLFVFRQLITDILLGSQWTEAVDFLGLWGLMSGVTIVFTSLSSEVYRSKGNAKLAMLVQAIHLAFLVAVVIISINYGFEILCIFRALVRLQSVVAALIVMHFVYKFDFLKTAKNLFPIIISTLIMSFVGWVLSIQNSSILWQVFSVVICIIVYFAVLLIGFAKLRNEVFEIPAINKFINKFKK